MSGKATITSLFLSCYIFQIHISTKNKYLMHLVLGTSEKQTYVLGMYLVATLMVEYMRKYVHASKGDIVS